MKHYGYIEGYYGKMLRWEERVSMVDHLKKLGLNTYIYAPKEDPYHRQYWKKSYPNSWTKKFKALCAHGRNKHVKIVPAIAPGLSFDYQSKNDYRLLLKKFKMLFSAGTETAALLMDDIEAALPSGNQKAFRSLGEAHGLLCGKLQIDLRKSFPESSLWFCPTIYTDRFCENQDLRKSAYLTDLAAYLPEDTLLFWTGTDVVSPSINVRNISYVNKLFINRIMIWDNYYANDYCQERVFVGPMGKRSRDILKINAGFFQNPTGLFETDKLVLCHFSDWLKGKYGNEIWKARIKQAGVPEQFFKVQSYFRSPFEVFKGKNLNSNRISLMKKSLHYLLFDWKSTLQMELYSFFHHLHRDLELYSNKDKKTDDFRLLRKFTGIMSSMVRKKQHNN